MYRGRNTFFLPFTLLPAPVRTGVGILYFRKGIHNGRQPLAGLGPAGRWRSRFSRQSLTSAPPVGPKVCVACKTILSLWLVIL